MKLVNILNPGALSAILAAATFGVSPVLAKLWAIDLPPTFLAGFLYLGSGIGLAIFCRNPLRDLAALSFSQRLKLVGAIIAGGVLGPLAFTASLKFATAFEISVLLNLETVLTTLIAAVFFREHVSRRALLSMGLLVTAASIAAIPSEGIPIQWRGGWLVVAACSFWALDNNLTREIENVPATLLATLRGFSAGTFNIALGMTLLLLSRNGAQVALPPAQIGAALGIGAICYGLSLILLIRALREVGSSRALTYFAVGPFFGIFSATLLLSEPIAPHQWIAALIGALGVWILHREHHEHLHTHEPLYHSHAHTHGADGLGDDHHRHGHASQKPHVHFHRHEPITHAHPHAPDIHHRHEHDSASKGGSS